MPTYETEIAECAVCRRPALLPDGRILHGYYHKEWSTKLAEIGWTVTTEEGEYSGEIDVTRCPNCTDVKLTPAQVELAWFGGSDPTNA